MRLSAYRAGVFASLAQDRADALFEQKLATSRRQRISPLQVVELPQTLNDPFHVRLNTQGSEASG